MEIDQLVTRIRSRFDHEQHRRVLKEKYQSKMIFSYNDGLFRASPEMITLLSLYNDQEIVVEDLYEAPIKVRASELAGLMSERWQEQMNAWLVDYEDTKSRR